MTEIERMLEEVRSALSVRGPTAGTARVDGGDAAPVARRYGTERLDLVVLDLLPAIDGVVRAGGRIAVLLLTTRDGEAGEGPGTAAAGRGVLEAAGVRLDQRRHEVTVRGDPVELPLKEYQLLEALMENRGRVLTRQALIDRVWGVDYAGSGQTVDVHVKRLRARIEADRHHPELIVTVRGVGYRFEG